MCRLLAAAGWFDFLVLCFIGLNCLSLAVERPTIPPWSTERAVLTTANHVFTAVFAAELAIKVWVEHIGAAAALCQVVAGGLVLGPGAYLTDNWNRLDGLLVLLSLADTGLTLLAGGAGGQLRFLRVFRLVRALRPLRVINRAPGLKLVVQTLLSSLKPISNIVIICCAFFLIFGILGVQVRDNS